MSDGEEGVGREGGMGMMPERIWKGEAVLEEWTMREGNIDGEREVTVWGRRG